jgi:hypothetical protein
MKEDDLKDVLSFDKTVFGSDRTRVLRRTYEDNPGLCHVALNQGNDITAFTMGIGSTQVAEIGPWVCANGIQDVAAEALIRATAGDAGKNAILVVVPGENDRPISILETLGLKREFEVATMRLGESVDYGQPGGIFALASLAHG